MSRKPRVPVVGDLMRDTVVRAIEPTSAGSDAASLIEDAPGGSGANVAVALAREGVAPTLVARVGATDVARETARLRALGVEARLAGDRSTGTGRLVALVDAAGERTFFSMRGASARLKPADAPASLLDEADWLHLSGYLLFSPASVGVVPRLIAAALRRGVPVSVDPASAAPLRAFGAERFLAATEGATLLLPNEDEARALVPGASVDEALDALAARYPMVALKRGPAGATLTIGGRRLEAPARAIRVMDSTGAGDSFAAAFIARLSLGATASAALAAAIRAGTRACRRLGAQ